MGGTKRLFVAARRKLRRLESGSQRNDKDRDAYAKTGRDHRYEQIGRRTRCIRQDEKRRGGKRRRDRRGASKTGGILRRMR